VGAESPSSSTVPLTPSKVAAANFVAAKKVGIDALMQLDAEDESLRKWKENLLASTSPVSDDPRNLVIQKMEIVFDEDEKQNPVVFALNTPEAIEACKNTQFVLKENANYRMRLVFNVNKDIVPALRLLADVYKKSICVNKSEEMIGSYGPRRESYEYISDVGQAPSGIFARGKYAAKCRFLDDDGNIHYEWEYAFEIKKTWS
jgi:Rho GDP-dissociation inhibitor